MLIFSFIFLKQKKLYYWINLKLIIDSVHKILIDYFGVLEKLK